MKCTKQKAKELDKVYDNLPKRAPENTPFPDCAMDCEVMPILGAGECENVCPHKFDQNGDPLSKK